MSPKTARALALTLLIAVAGILSARQSLPSVAPQEKRGPETAQPSLAQLAASLTLEEKVGQLFLLGHWADSDPATTTARIARYHPGGILLMSAPSPAAEIRRWTREWRQAAAVPPLIAIDQEGGEVSRIREPGYLQVAQPALTTPEEARRAGRVRAAQLRALGIHANLAPVVDRAVREDAYLRSRVFPADAIATLSAAYINGMRAEGLLSVVKHFPGHPDTPEDSHTALPTIHAVRDKAEDYLAPFRETLWRARPEAVMAGHILFPALDAAFPASVSRTLLTGTLRKQWGYAGVIMTDDLIMRGVADRYGPADAAIAALAAGADMIMLAAKPELIETVYPAVLDAYRTGALSRRELEMSVRRILTLKKKAGMAIPHSLPPKLGTTDNLLGTINAFRGAYLSDYTPGCQSCPLRFAAMRPNHLDGAHATGAHGVELL